MNIPRIVSLLIFAALLGACSSAETDWKTAAAADTAAGFKNFLEQHPNNAHAQEARDRLTKLKDDQAWADAQTANRLAVYQLYLQKEPSGAHAADAGARITELQREADWKTAQAANTEVALQDFLKKYSQGREADQARAQLQKLAGYRVELATSRNEKAAEKSRNTLQTRLKSELHAVVIVPPTHSGKIYRVTSGPMSESDAETACTKLKKEHQHCEVIKS